MFKIECLVDDKRLADVLHALAGKVHNLTSIPVENAQVVKGKVQAVNNGSVVGFVQSFIAKHKLKDFETSQISDAVAKGGWKKRNAANYALNTLKEQGVVRLVRKGRAHNPSKWRTM